MSVQQEILMKGRLKLLLNRNISPVILQNCIDLIEREQVGIQKYGTTLSEANLSRGELLQHAREEALDLANYLLAEQHKESSITYQDSLKQYIQNYRNFSESKHTPESHKAIYRMVAGELSRLLRC